MTNKRTVRSFVVPGFDTIVLTLNLFFLLLVGGSVIRNAADHLAGLKYTEAISTPHQLMVTLVLVLVTFMVNVAYVVVQIVARNRHNNVID